MRQCNPEQLRNRLSDPGCSAGLQLIQSSLTFRFQGCFVEGERTSDFRVKCLVCTSGAGAGAEQLLELLRPDRNGRKHPGSDAVVRTSADGVCITDVVGPLYSRRVAISGVIAYSTPPAKTEKRRCRGL